jgi:AcrR family transcriptional regulator
MDDPEPKREGGRAARRASDTHQRLLQAAISVFSELGFDGCAIEDITEKADVGKGTFYRHFHDKHAILAALIERALNDLETRIAKSPTPAASLETSLSHLVHAHTAMYREQRDLFLLILQAQAMMATRKASLPELHAPFARYWSLLENQLAFAPTPGATPAHPPSLAAAVSGSVFGTIMASLAAMPPDAVEARLNDLSKTIVSGIVQHLRCAV